MEPTDFPQVSNEPVKAELEARLQPGAWSRFGFLGKDDVLDEVVAQDAATLACLGLDYDELADAVDDIILKVLELYRRPVPPEEIPSALARQTHFPNLYHPETIPHFDRHNLPNPHLGFLIGYLQVFVVCYKGWQDCPWGDGATGNCDFMILNRETGESVTVPQLMPHLIRSHRFFEGFGTPFRTDPAQLARVLGLDQARTLQPGTDSGEECM